MPFGVANTPALFQELMNKILSILRRRPKVQELISRGALMEAHIDDVCLGTNTQEDHLILLGEVFAVCQENHTRLKLEKCEFMQETMQYLGFDVGYGWWTPVGLLSALLTSLLPARAASHNRFRKHFSRFQGVFTRGREELCIILWPNCLQNVFAPANHPCSRYAA